VQLTRATCCYNIAPNPSTKMEEPILIPSMLHNMPLPAPEPLDADDDLHVHATPPHAELAIAAPYPTEIRRTPSSSCRYSDTLYLPSLESDASLPNSAASRPISPWFGATPTRSSFI
jgi:hypothetical protein